MEFITLLMPLIPFAAGMLLLLAGFRGIEKDREPETKQERQPEASSLSGTLDIPMRD